MYISKVSLVNYRNFENSYFLFNKGINTIIGENASGKTNLFRAIRLILDDNLLSYAYKLNENDFNRNLINWKGRWIIISLEFSEISNEEAIQALFVYAQNRTTGRLSSRNSQSGKHAAADCVPPYHRFFPAFLHLTFQPNFQLQELNSIFSLPLYLFLMSSQN